MAINPNNGVLDIVNGVLKVSSIDIKESGGFATAINTVARNDVLLYDDQHTNTTFLPAEGTDYRSTTGVTRDTSSIDFNDGWVYWPLKLPNSWHAQFDMRITATGGVFTFSLFNTSTPNHTDYTANDGGYKIVFDNTNNQIDVYWEGSVHATASANVRSTDWQHVNINYFKGAVSISLAGKVVLNHGFTENYQEADSRYLGFSATSGTSHEIRNLAIHNSDKWLYTHTSNASDIAYVSGNVGIGSLAPTELLDVHGNVHIAKDLTVDGNLTVSGTTTFIDTANMSIEDPIIELAKGNASDTIDSGLVITRATSNVAVAYRGDESELALAYTQSGASDTDVVPVADGGLDVRVYGNLFANNLTTTANVNATYVKGDGSELTGITLGSVIDYGNTSSNTIQLTNSDIGLVATGNIQANYFVGDGSRLTGLVTTLESVTDNGNTTSNTVQFTNSTTALVADSNVGIGTHTPSANLHVVGNQYVNDPPTQSASFDHSDAPLTLTHSTPTSTTAIDDPKAVLHLARDGTSGESYGAKASFKMSRYENSGAASRSRLDVTLADGTYVDTSVMTVRSDGRVGINTTTPGYGLDVHGTANVGALTTTSVSGDGSALYGIQSSNVSDFGSNVTRIGNLESNLSANSLRITTVTNDLSDNSSRITSLESSDMTITGEKTFSSNVEVGTGNLFVDTTTSNVGIGKTTPGYTLDVAGDINLSGDFYQGGSPFVSSLWTDGADALYYRSNVEVGTGNLFVDTTTSNVGIGKTTPGYTLDVAGDINLSGDFYQGGSPFVSSLWTEGTDSLYYRSNVEMGTANLFVDATQGYVGIGTTTPTAELDVVGNVHVSNNISGNSLTINTVSVTTTMGLDEVLNVGNTSSNTIQITNTTESVSNTTGAIVVSGGLGVGSNLFVGKDLTVSGAMTINTVALSTTTNLQEVTNDGNTTTNTVEFNNPTTSLVAAGNVEVDGALTVTSGVSTSGLVAAGTLSTDGNIDYGLGSGTRISFPSDDTITFTTDAFERVRINSSGNVGIGTNSPLQQLHVRGNGENPVIYMSDPSNNRYSSGMGSHHVGGVGQRLDFYNGDSGANGTSLTSSHTRMSIVANGNVGIATTNPSAKLHVQGDLYVSSPKIQNLFYAPPNWGYTDSSNYETNLWSFTYNAPADGYLILNVNAHYNYPYANQSFYAWISVDNKTNDNSTLYDSTTVGAAAGDGGHFHEYNDTGISWKDMNHSTSAYVSAGNHTISLRFQKFTNTYSLSINGAAIKLLFIPKNYM